MTEAIFELASSHSMRISLEAVRNGDGGLDAHRQSMLNRVERPGSWVEFQDHRLTMKDLAYLTAKTGHEFAILRGKHSDILFHGETTCCCFDTDLSELLYSKKFLIFGHSHPGEPIPTPSPQDRNTLIALGQTTSKIISAITGTEITFSTNPFDDFDF